MCDDIITIMLKVHDLYQNRRKKCLGNFSARQNRIRFSSYTQERLPRLILHAVGLSGGADAIAGIAEMGVAIVLLFVWGWPVVKGLFGITAIGAIFSGNVVIGVVLFVVYLTLAYFLGIIFAFIGTIRYIYLRIKYGKNQ